MTKSSGFRYFLCLMAVVAIIAATFAVATGDILGSILAALQLAISPALLVIALLAAIPYYFLFVRREQVAAATFPKMGEQVRHAPTVEGGTVNYVLQQDEAGYVVALPEQLFKRTTPAHKLVTAHGLRQRGLRYKLPDIN